MSLLDGTDARTRAKRHMLPVSMVAHQFKPEQVASPLGAGAILKDKRNLYRLARIKTLAVVPEIIDRQIELARSPDDLAANSLLDRAGIRAIDKPEDLNGERPKFDASLLSREERAQVAAALRLMAKGGRTARRQLM